MAPLNDLERKIVGHLPVWAADEEAHVEAEGGPDASVRCYTLVQLHERLLEDVSIQPPLELGALAVALAELVRMGLVSRDGTGDEPATFRMTEQGFGALHAPVEEQDQVVGAVTIALNPAHSASKATA